MKKKLIAAGVITMAVAGVVSASILDRTRYGNEQLAGLESDPALTTQTSRLLARYLLSDDPSFEMLMTEARAITGGGAEETLLKHLDKTYLEDEKYAPDRSHCLKGKLLSQRGEYQQAAEEFKLALRKNPANHDARKSLTLLYFSAGSYDLAEEQVEEALKYETDEGQVGFYQTLLQKIRQPA